MLSHTLLAGLPWLGAQEINLSFRVLLQFTEGLAVSLSEVVAHYERIQRTGEHSSGKKRG